MMDSKARLDKQVESVKCWMIVHLAFLQTQSNILTRQIVLKIFIYMELVLIGFQVIGNVTFKSFN
jgi:hypothetical protein